jgi:general secretion pathway protein H
VHSGAGAAVIQIPQDVLFSALLAERCGGRRVGSTIDFFPTGASCGGAIAISREGYGYQIRVNWLTGAVDVVANGKS